MSFVWPVYLWGLLLLPLVLGVVWWGARRRRRSAAAFADEHLLPDLIQRPGRVRARWPLALQLVALSSLLVAGARPQAPLPLLVNQAAVIIAIDASKSMLATDVEPSRLELGRTLALNFLAGVPASTQVGLVSFSDAASVLVPPTLDRSELREAIERVEPAQNTSLSAAVVSGVRLLPGRRTLSTPQELEPPGFGPTLPTIPLSQLDEELERASNPPPGSILIFSDGVANVDSNPELSVESALDIAARFATDNAVKLYTVALGQDGGTVSRIEGEDFFIPFEPDNLEQLAERTEGDTIDPEDEDALRALVRDLGTSLRWETKRTELAAPLTGVALALLLLGAAISLHLNRRVP